MLDWRVIAGGYFLLRFLSVLVTRTILSGLLNKQFAAFYPSADAPQSMYITSEPLTTIRKCSSIIIGGPPKRHIPATGNVRQALRTNSGPCTADLALGLASDKSSPFCHLPLRLRAMWLSNILRVSLAGDRVVWGLETLEHVVGLYKGSFRTYIVDQHHFLKLANLRIIHQTRY